MNHSVAFLTVLLCTLVVLAVGEHRVVHYLDDIASSVRAIGECGGQAARRAGP